MGCASQYSKSQRSEKQRSKKGTVGVESVKGMLRLRWRCPHLKRQRSKSLNLEDTPVNWTVAQQRALQIQQDIATQNYDPTLVK
ncbi:MAG: hypothetical protein ACFB8W_05270 [Elainellaceae cyanobacterium]